MANIRSVNEIILSLIDFFKTSLPDLDTKPGTVARDLFIDGPASQLSLLYDEMSTISDKQSLRLVVGSDLDKLAKNFGVARKQSTPSSGIAVLTFSSINSTININKGDTVTANNGFSFSVVSGISVSPSSLNYYRSIATKYREQLDFAGISDEYAITVAVQATSSGSVGNIGTYSIVSTNVSGASNATNLEAFKGGTDQETDAAFRSRVLSTFSGSSVGTALGYLNVALGVSGVQDAVVIEPGNPLMTRDGTVVTVASDGSSTIVSEGSGGKVDIVIMGTDLVQNTDSFIYQDKSNNNDPTSSKNDVVLGQIAGDENKTINRKRIDNIKNGVVPAQPVDSLIQVVGSSSGGNFIAKTVDSYGLVSGNYELVKDTGAYRGSPFGFDKFRWVSNKISLFSEDRIKGQFNGQDPTTFTDVLEIPQVQQTIPITNENSTVTSDRSIIRLLHTPATSVTRVFNVNTGERYLITNQNLDETGTYNTTGRIKISGNTLPSASDLLQVDYNWVINFDQYSDYDGLSKTDNPRDVKDSIDWGFSSAVRHEKVLFSNVLDENFFIGTTSLPINTVISANKFLEVDGTIETVASGNFINRLAVVIPRLSTAPQSIASIKFKNSNTELYNTAQADSTYTVTTEVVGIEIYYTITVILPTDTVAEEGDSATAILDSNDVFYSTTIQGTSSETQITIPSELIDTEANNITLDVTYVANITDLFSSATTSLPASRTGNGFALSNNLGFSNFSIANISRRENQVVQLNLSAQYYVELNLSSNDFTLTEEQVVSVVRLTDGYELWNKNHQGTINIGTSGNYQLILSGFNSPATTNRVLVIYYVTDSRKFQPFNFSNKIIKTRTDRLSYDFGVDRFTLSLNKFESESGMTFSIFEPNTDITLFNDGYSGVDGELTDMGDGTATLTSASIDFSTVPDILNKKIELISAGDDNNNDGVYDIIDYDLGTDTLTITNRLDKVNIDQICVIKMADGQEIWNYSGSIDTDNNRILLPSSLVANENDRVFVMLFNFDLLRKSPTRLIATTIDQVTNQGIITISGTTISKADNIIFTATNTGLKLNLAEAIRKNLSLNSSATISSNIKIAKIIKVEKVVTASATDDTVLDVLTVYDTKNTTIQNNLFYLDEMLSDPTLQSTDFVLPNTTVNSTNLVTKNLPTIGDKIRVTFYYTTENDAESLSYTRNGTLFTNKQFALINKIFISSGFRSSQSTRFTASSFTQPQLGSRYKVFYDYTAPKQNERITLTYYYNKLVSDVTFSVENTRPINADVLVKDAKEIAIDLTMNVVIDPLLASSEKTILQNLRSQLITVLTATELNQIIDQVTLINTAQSINGISRARILYFNKTGLVGQVLKIQAQEDEYFVPNIITINTETR